MKRPNNLQLDLCYTVVKTIKQYCSWKLQLMKFLNLHLIKISNFKLFIFATMIFVLIACKEKKLNATYPNQTSKKPTDNCKPGAYCPSYENQNKDYPQNNPEYNNPERYSPYPSSPVDSGGDGKGKSTVDGNNSNEDLISSIIGKLFPKNSSKDYPSKNPDENSPIQSPQQPGVTPATPSVNACDMSVNQMMSVNNYSFNMTKRSYEVYATIGTTGIYGNFAVSFNGDLTSALSSFSYYVKNGKLMSSGPYNMSRATVTVDGMDRKFAELVTGNFNFGSRGYQVKYDLKRLGACMAVYGNYSGEILY